MRPAPVLAVGASPGPRRFGPLTRVDIARFAGAGGDFNPLHFEDEVARRAGFVTVIAMGQLQAGVVAGVLSDWVGLEHVRRFEVRFSSPLGLGDVLQVTAEVVEVADASARIDLTGRVGDRVVIGAHARVDVGA